jgi:hypothetical protein
MSAPRGRYAPPVPSLLRAIADAFVDALKIFGEAARQGLLGALYVLNPIVGKSVIETVRKRKPDESLLEERLEELSETMKKSADLVTEVEAALQARQAAVEKLRADAETAQQIKDMTEDQRKAVANVLRAEVAREGKKTLWQGAAVNGFFFLAGVGVALWIEKAM